jgi:hypothetical protein
VNQGADTAGTLGKEVGVSRIAALEDDLQASEKGTGAPRVLHFAFFYLNFNA